MIDIENEIFTILADELRENFKPISIVGEYKKTPAKFPHVSIIEFDNGTYKRGMDCKERHSRIVYEINIYSNLQFGKKEECKKILKVIDDKMLELGFTRTFRRHIPNVEDATIHRILVRYYGIVDERKYIFRG